MSIIDSIQLSGSSYDVRDKSATTVVSLTQQEYDALPSSAKTANILYNITDAQAGDLTQYWTSAQTQSAITEATSGLQQTLTAGTGIDITDNVISATGGGGGGKAIVAGRGITVTTGATADTISFNLPISGGSGSYSIIENYQSNTASGYYSHAEGHSTKAQAESSHAEGESTTASGAYGSHAEGRYTKATGVASHAEGYYTEANNNSEHASGKYNKSNSGSTDADNTLFSVGNGTSTSARHNAFEIRLNGDIYITSGSSDIKLQDHLGGGGGGGGNPTVELTQAQYDALVTAGTVSADTYYIITDAPAITVTTAITSSSTDTQVPSAKAVYDQLGGLKLVKLTQSEYDALAPNYDSNTLYVIVN